MQRHNPVNPRVPSGWWLALLITLQCCCFSVHAESRQYELVQPQMGTTARVVVEAEDLEEAGKAMRAAQLRIAELNKVLSDYDPNSELSRLSSSAPTPRPVPLSDPLFEVLQRAQAISVQSQGAFDVTVGPLSSLWRRARRLRRLPTDERLRRALHSVGYRHLRIDVKKRTAQLKVPGMRLDLGAIGKGYAADAALEVLKQKGLCRAMVEIGGDIAIGDPPRGKSGWRVAIAPLKPKDPPSRVLRLANCGVATSGDVWQFVEINGRRYSHIVNPRTGLGLSRRSSVTVIAQTGMDADAMASVASVLGPRKGCDWIDKQPQAHAFVVFAGLGKIETRQTRSFGKVLEKSKLPHSH